MHCLEKFWCIALLSIGLTNTASKAVEQQDGKFVLTMLEIPPFERGGGLALVMKTPAGHWYMYDTGIGYPLCSNPTTLSEQPAPNAEQHLLDVEADRWQGGVNHGRDVVLPWLTRHGVKKLDGVTISHAHYDHFGGLLWLDKQIPIKRLYDSGYVFRGETPDSHPHILAEIEVYNALRERFRSRGAYTQGNAGATFDWDPALRVEVIAPPETFFVDPVPDKRKPTDPPSHFLVNANSIGLRITHGDVVFSLPGDVQGDDQLHSLLKHVPPEKLRADVLIAPAHGIHADNEYAKAVRPKLVLCSVVSRFAKDLRAARVYQELGAEVLVNAINGELTVESDGRTFRVYKQRETPAESEN
jgi:competence protein ComEC